MAGNGEIKNRSGNGVLDEKALLQRQVDGLATDQSSSGSAQTTKNLIICVVGIYASFLTWGLLQERITTTQYGSSLAPEKFNSPVFINTVQSTFAALLGYLYVLFTCKQSNDLPIFPSRSIVFPMFLVAITSSLASPFGYASLKHVDYITFILAKSCKLLPVMALHVTLFRRKYPLYKYCVVALVTAGVAVFTLHHPTSSKKKGADGSSAWGLLLLGINLLFDGLTNSTQDHIYKSYRPYTGQQMMCALNSISTVLTSVYLFVSPYISTTPVGAYLGMSAASGGELGYALDFIRRHPSVGWDIFAFAACGALGQMFIFYTLSTFGSLLLVTVTVTRKMLTMILSVVWFGHRLSPMQWVGVGLVFGGVFVEAQLSKQEKLAKDRAKKGEVKKSS
ncbi:UAA transporter, partial [Aureobasidium melanogenum]